MEHKKLGFAIIGFTILLAVVLAVYRVELEKSILSKVISTGGNQCLHEGNICPYEELDNLTLPTYIAIAVLVLMFGVGSYFSFFDKSQERINQLTTQLKEDEKQEIKKETAFSLLNEDEQKIVKAIAEQEGIQQATLKYRVGMSKTKLSLMLKELGERGIICKEEEGKTNRIYLKNGFFSEKEEPKR